MTKYFVELQLLAQSLPKLANVDSQCPLHIGQCAVFEQLGLVEDVAVTIAQLSNRHTVLLLKRLIASVVPSLRAAFASSSSRPYFLVKNRSKVGVGNSSLDRLKAELFLCY